MNPVKPALEKLNAVIQNVEDALTQKATKDEALAAAESSPTPAPTSTDSPPQADSTATDSKPIEGNGAGDKKVKKKKDKQKNKDKRGKDGKPVPLPLEQSQWLQCDLRVGRVSSVEGHPEASGLYVLQVSYGEGVAPRTVCAGMRNYLSEDEMKDLRVVTICNLKPRKIRGVESQAMILAGSVVSQGDGQKEKVVPLSPPSDAGEGAIITVDGMQALERTVEDGKFVSGKTWDRVVPRLSVKDGSACYDGAKLLVDGKPVMCDLPDGAEIH